MERMAIDVLSSKEIKNDLVRVILDNTKRDKKSEDVVDVELRARQRNQVVF